MASAPTLPYPHLFTLNRHREHITRCVPTRARYPASPQARFRLSAEKEAWKHWNRSVRLYTKVHAAVTSPNPFASTPVAILEHYTRRRCFISSTSVTLQKGAHRTSERGLCRSRLGREHQERFVLTLVNPATHSDAPSSPSIVVTNITTDTPLTRQGSTMNEAAAGCPQPWDCFSPPLGTLRPPLRIEMSV